MNTNKLYRICTNNKEFDAWCKEMKKKLSKSILIDHFNQGYVEVAKGKYLARASFVCYWEIYSNGNIAKLAPAITQASLIHLLHRFIEKETYEKVEVITKMLSDFLRLLNKVNEQDGEEESEQE